MATVGSSTPVKNSSIDSATFKANYKKNVGQDFDTRCFDGKTETASANSGGGSGGGNSDPLGFISTAIGFVTNPVATITSLLTGKNT